MIEVVVLYEAVIYGEALERGGVDLYPAVETCMNNHGMEGSSSDVYQPSFLTRAQPRCTN